MKQRFAMMVGHTLTVELKQEIEEVYHRKYYKLKRKEQAYSSIVDIFVIYYVILILTLRIMWSCFQRVGMKFKCVYFEKCVVSIY